MELKLVFLILAQLHLSRAILLETTKSSVPVEYDCDKVKFKEENFVTCVCLDGIWAFYISNINQAPQWKVFGGESKCYQMGQWVTRIKRVSHFSHKSSIRRLKDNENIFVVTNSQNWGIDLGGQRKCLYGQGPKSYCIYEIKCKQNINETLFTVGCDRNSTALRPSHCGIFEFTDDEPAVCDLREGNLKKTWKPQKLSHLSRVKRDASQSEKSPSKDMDEDFMDPNLLGRYTGDVQITDSIADYIKSAASEMLELSRVNKNGKDGNGSSKKEKTPVQALLDLANNITKITCPVISEDTFNIAINSFKLQQNDRNHLKEPYVSYTAFQRIVKALKKCQEDAQPHVFILNSDPDSCIDSRFKIAQTVSRSGLNVTLDSLPKFAIADPLRHEPLIELVWKTFLITHSYCYRYFSDYFNDHHTFTVAVMPYFSNKIQSTWFIKDGKSNVKDEQEEINPVTVAPEPLDSTLVTDPVYKTESIWYGNLLGDTAKVLEKIDHCYSASRIVSDEHPIYMYPWYMNRPPRDRTNEWRRKKRSTPNKKLSCDFNYL
ncbi:unnamed protein product [Allacma fusca]|uniref:Uncharacterized protein n=1 Tax=Allacma fusca TaxID=39272 RepID=A0A8J2M8K0_9HEXA|nr:unnamed protein product [Allacma fusca]